jgi:LAS superfamily LD-carboxypeptidase LdcB
MAVSGQVTARPGTKPTAKAAVDTTAPQPLEAGDPAPVEPSGSGDVTHLQPLVRRALDRATRDAAAAGIDLNVTSGWRSADRQRVLYEEAIAKYGTAERARRWVLPPGESEHVTGGAVDVGPRSAAAWLEEHGVHYGLCRRYANEPWHFELLAPHKGQPCPAMEPHA